MDEYGRKEQVRDTLGCLLMLPMVYIVAVFLLSL